MLSCFLSAVAVASAASDLGAKLRSFIGNIQSFKLLILFSLAARSDPMVFRKDHFSFFLRTLYLSVH